MHGCSQDLKSRKPRPKTLYLQDRDETETCQKTSRDRLETETFNTETTSLPKRLLPNRAGDTSSSHNYNAYGVVGIYISTRIRVDIIAIHYRDVGVCREVDQTKTQTQRHALAYATQSRSDILGAELTFYAERTRATRTRTVARVCSV